MRDDVKGHSHYYRIKDILVRFSGASGVSHKSFQQSNDWEG